MNVTPICFTLLSFTVVNVSLFTLFPLWSVPIRVQVFQVFFFFLGGGGGGGGGGRLNFIITLPFILFSPGAGSQRLSVVKPLTYQRLKGFK